jgi:hypothetical protein
MSSSSDLLPESWTEVSVSVSEEISPVTWEIDDETQAVLGRVDRGGAQVDRTGHTGSGADPAVRDIGADVLPLEKAVCGPEVEPGPALTPQVSNSAMS